MVLQICAENPIEVVSQITLKKNNNQSVIYF